MEKLKHKFREVSKPLKTNVSRKYFPTVDGENPSTYP
jgi:hypothetical protein